MWKAIKDMDHPLEIQKHQPPLDARSTRSTSAGTLTIPGLSNITRNICNGIDGKRVNRTPSTPISVLRYDVDNGLNFILEFNIYPSLTSHIKVGSES